MERRKRRSPVEEYVDALMDSPEKLQRCTQFYQNLRAYYRRKWNCPLKAPHIQGVELNLFRLYNTVVSFGGWQKVSLSEKWGQVAQAIGVAEGVAVAEHAVKVLYMRYLSKYEQSELVGEVDDNDSDLLGSRSRGKGFSSLATADCPVSMGAKQAADFFRTQPEKKTEAEYERLIKSLLSGLPNEVDFAVNVCTLLSHPGPRVLRLASAPQLITVLVAHVAVFADGDSSMFELYKSWSAASGRDFIEFWRGAGIEDEEILALLPNVSRSKVPKEEVELFSGLETDFHPRHGVSWRVQQILSIMRNLSFEVINKPVMAANWPLLKFLFVASNCKWSALRTAALDALSNIANEIDLMCEESSATNHLLLKTVSRCLHSDDKIQVIRALEILSGLCNNEHNESLLCEFLDVRVLNKIFDVIIVKDIMMCVYTLEALYQISELGAAACQQLSLYPHAIDILVDLATIEAVSFGPSGLVGMKVVEFHGPPQLAPPPPQNLAPSGYTTHAPRPGAFAAPVPPGPFHAPSLPAAHPPPLRSVPSGTPASTSSTNATVVGDSKVEQLTSKWLRLNCINEPGNVTPRGELYATYVDDLRNHYSALSGSVQMFTNILRAIFPSAVVRVGTNSSSMVIENIKLSKGHGVGTLSTIGSSTPPSTNSSSAMAASHPLVQKMLSESGPHLNGHLPSSVQDRTAHIREAVGSSSASPSSNISEEVSRTSPPTPSTSTILPSANKVQLEVCRAAVEARDFIPDDERHEAKIVRVENTCRALPLHPSPSPASLLLPPVNKLPDSSLQKSLVARRLLNGLVEDKKDAVLVNGDSQVNGYGSAGSRDVSYLPSGFGNEQKANVNGTSEISNGDARMDPIGRSVGQRARETDNSVACTSSAAIEEERNAMCPPSSSSSLTTHPPSSSLSTHPPSSSLSTHPPSSSLSTHPAYVAKRRRPSKPGDSAGGPSTSAESDGEFLCEWNGCGRNFALPSSMLYHCTQDHVNSEDDGMLQCHWPLCDSTVRPKWSMVTHLQDHHCNDTALQIAAKRRHDGVGIPLGPVNPEKPRDAQQHPGYSKNAAIEAIRRHAFNYLPRDITDDPEGPVTKSIRLTSSLILRNLARYSNDGRRLLRRHERLLCWLALSRVESSSALAQLLAELNCPPSTAS